MAIAFDSAGRVGGTGTSVSLSHTCSGNNRILIAGIKVYEPGGGDLLTGVTYAGVAMTQIGKVSQTIHAYFYLYYLINPATGANNIVASASGAPDEMDVFGSSYTGVKQSGQPDAGPNSGNSASPNTRTVTTIADNAWVVGYFCSDNGSAVAASTNTTDRANLNYAGMICDSNGGKTPPGSFSLVATGTTTITGIIASISPALLSVPIKRLNINQAVQRSNYY